MVKRLFLTPPNLPTTNATRCLVIPDSKEWLGIFNRALLMTAQAYNYEQVNETDVTPDIVAAACYQIYVDWLSGECCMNCDELKACLYGTGSQFRVNPTTGALERSDDGGATWETDTAHDPRYISPRLAMEAGSCTTASYQIGQIQQVVDQIKDVIAVAGGIAGLVGVLTGTIATILSAGAAAPLLVALGGATLGFTTAAIDAALTADVWERLLCNIHCATEGATEITEEMWQEILATIVSDETGTAETMLWNVVNFLGPVGLQNAVSMQIEGAFLPANCDDCDCDGLWCHTWSFAAGTNEWALISAGQSGTWDSSLQGWRAAQNNPTPNNYLGLRIFRDASAGGTITEIEFDIEQSNIKENSAGAGDVNIFQVRSGFGATGTLVWGTPKLLDVCGDEARHVRTYTGLNISGFNSIVFHLEAHLAGQGCGASNGSGIIRSVTIRGTGTPPWGEDNC